MPYSFTDTAPSTNPYKALDRGHVSRQLYCRTNVGVCGGGLRQCLYRSEVNIGVGSASLLGVITVTCTHRCTPLFNVLGSFDEFERSLIRERQREGIALAKKEGNYRGRKSALSIEQAEMLRRRAAGGEKKAALARELGISRETLFQNLRA